MARGLFGELTPRALPGPLSRSRSTTGLLKIMSKMGISVDLAPIAAATISRRSACRARWSPSSSPACRRASPASAWPASRQARSTHARARLDAGRRSRCRSAASTSTARGGETHALAAGLIHTAADAVAHRQLSDLQALHARRCARRRRSSSATCWTSAADAASRSPLDEVESINEIRKRFVTPGMSLGALSPEAHGTLNIAMNRIGAKSRSPARAARTRRATSRCPNGDNANSAIKQIASGRFGVTAEYLNQCREIEIKVAQGAKPGEGGQLPGFKVTELIAKLRHATPGVIADLPAAAPRHLFDRGPGAAHLRPEADQSGRQGVREAGRRDPASAPSRPASPRPRPT